MTTHDRWEPRLRVAASGFNGSGYRIPTRTGADGKPVLVPGVTTVLGHLEKGAVTQWAVDNTAAYAVANVDALLNRNEEQGFGFLRFYHKRMTSAKFDDPAIDIRDYSNGVLDDLAELGTITHDWVADFVNGYFEPELTRNEQAEMITEFLDWWEMNDVQVICSEATVVGDGYAGTLDHIWIVNGVPTLIDVKTSRKTRDTHVAQIGALSAAESMMVQVDDDHPDAVEYETKKWGKTYWIEQPVPAFSQHAILHLRPSDTDSQGNYMAPFCDFKILDQAVVEAGYEMFRGALQAAHGRARLKMLARENEKED